MKKPTTPRQKPTPAHISAAMEETLSLYHAWLALLLRRLGQETLQVSAAELKDAIGKLSCSVSRQDGHYIITMEAPRE